MSIKIGVFDSGIGGLTVLKELAEVIPAEYIYIGDTLRAPYGNKNKEELLTYTRDLLSFLKNKNVDLYISACNSLSTLDVLPLLSELGIRSEQYFDMTMFAEDAVGAISHDLPFLVYATEATIRSGIYQKIFASFSPYTLASRNLARAIEDKHDIEIDEEVDMLVDYILENNIKQVFLGCTHYPLIEEYLEKRLLGSGVTFINPAVYIKKVLSEVKDGDLKVSTIFTKLTPHAKELSKELFGKDAELTLL